jgi:hypothetical protein
MKQACVVGKIFYVLICSSISLLALTSCGGDSGPTPGGLAIITTSLPEGQVKQPYSASVGGSGGTLPYLWSVTPALPAGLSLNTQSGAITGTPGTVATSSHTFTLADSSLPPQIVEQSLSLTIKPPLSISTTSLPAGNIGAVYNQPVQTVGGAGPLTFNIVVPGTGTLPPGFNLNPATGAISGTATATGNFPFTVRVADTSGQQDTQALTIVINPSSPPQIMTSSLPGGTVGQPYSQTLQAAAGIGTLTWSIPVGSLPPGLTIVPPATGPSVTIAGTPTSQGTATFTVRVTDTLGQFATRQLSITVNLPSPPRITTTSLPAGSIGQTYNQPVLTQGGTGPLTFTIASGTFPPGLDLSATTGTITGAPTATGSFSFTVRVADTFGQDDTQALSILVNTSNPPQITTTSPLPGGTVGVSYNQPLQVSGGNGTLVWSAPPGSLAGGLTLSPSGTISGTPTNAEISNFTVTVTDSLGQTDAQDLSITVSPAPPPLSMTIASLPAGAIGQFYNQTLQATGGTGARTWNISAGSLPLGLDLDSTTGVISGTPILPAGTSNFTVRVQDAGGQVDAQPLSITINLLNPPDITPTTLPGGTVGEPYNQTLQATGGVGALTWTLAGGSLPAMLSLSQAGVISGSPTTAGSSNFTVRVADTLGQSDTQDLSIVISPVAPPPPTPPDITTTTLPAGTVNQVYTQTTVEATGGTPPLTWTISAGIPPDGLSLDGTTGLISGTPTAAGTSPFTVQVQDAGGLSDTQDLSILIDP